VVHPVRGDLNYWKFENSPTRSTFNVVNVNAHPMGGQFGWYRETYREVDGHG